MIVGELVGWLAESFHLSMETVGWVMEVHGLRLGKELRVGVWGGVLEGGG